MNIPPSLTSRKVRYLPIWEIRLRLWHWTNLLIVLLLFESYLLFDWHKELGLSRPTTALFQKAHIYLGYAFILLFLGRFYLLFKGDPSSRFREIVPAFKGRGLVQTLREEILHHLSPPRDSAGKLLPPADPGHNQLARFLYLPLLTVVIPVQIVSGVLWSSVKWGFWPPAVPEIAPGSPPPHAERNPFEHSRRVHVRSSGVHRRPPLWHRAA